MISLAYCYLNIGEINLAIKTYQQAIKTDENQAITYLILGEIYLDMGQEDKAIDNYRLGIEKCLTDSYGYTSILFDLGLIEQRKGTYVEAEKRYKQILEINPNDYPTYSKLIQLYNQTKKYDKIKPLKNVLYVAHDKGQIKEEDMSDMFCIDQFKINEHNVMAFERYESGKKDFIYNKIVFYILDSRGNILHRIQTEYSPPLVSMGRGTYMLCGNVDDTHLNYGITLDDNTKYSTIKEYVVNIVEGKTKTATFRNLGE